MKKRGKVKKVVNVDRCTRKHTHCWFFGPHELGVVMCNDDCFRCKRHGFGG